MVEQANGVVSRKITAWKADHNSTQWAESLTEVTLAINTQIHSSIQCAPAELLFRERSSYKDWLNNQKRQDLSIGIDQEDPNRTPIYGLTPEKPRQIQHISEPNIQMSRESISHNTEITIHISSSSSSSDIDIRLTPPLIPSLSKEPEPDSVITAAQAATERSRIRMMRKYSKHHTIEHFEINDIISIKIPKEDRTSTDNKRIFGKVLEEPYNHRYRILTHSGILKRLIPTKSLVTVDKALWSDIKIPSSTEEVTLREAARDASTSIRIAVSCQCKAACNTRRCRCFREMQKCSVHCHKDEYDCGNLSALTVRTEAALIEPPQRRRTRATRRKTQKTLLSE